MEREASDGAGMKGCVAGIWGLFFCSGFRRMHDASVYNDERNEGYYG